MNNEELYTRWRQLQRQARAFAQLYATIREEETGHPTEDNPWERASGGTICPTCGMHYYEHPQERESKLTIVCDGSFYHL